MTTHTTHQLYNPVRQRARTGVEPDTCILYESWMHPPFGTRALATTLLLLVESPLVRALLHEGQQPSVVIIRRFTLFCHAYPKYGYFVFNRL